MNNGPTQKLPTQKLKALAAAAVMVATTAALPAHAKTADDIERCRDALSADGSYIIQAHTLKFLGTRGNTQNKTVRLRLKNKSTAEKQLVTCVIKKGKVVDISMK